MEDEMGEERVWKWVAMVAVVLAAGLLGIVLQATRGVLPSGERIDEASRQAIWRRLDEGQNRGNELGEEISRLRRDLERHLAGRGIGVPAGVSVESK